VNGLVRSSNILQPGGHSSINEEPASSSNLNTIRPTHDEIIDILETHHDNEGRVSLMDSTSQYVEDNITFENSDTFGHDASIRSFSIEPNVEHVDAVPSTRSYNEEASTSGSSGFTFNNSLEPDNFPYARMDSTPSLSSSNSMFTATFYLPGSVPRSFVSHVKEQFHNLAHRKIQQWKSSVVLQGPLSTHPVVLAKAVKLLKDCVEVNKSCTLQLGTWGILYLKDEEIHLHNLRKGDVPINVEARWQEGKTNITMYGLNLNGVQTKVATEHVATTLRSTGPPTQDQGCLEQLVVNTEGMTFEEGSLIHAAKVVKVNGSSLLVRSEATHILPPLKASPLQVFSEALANQWHQIASVWTSSKTTVITFFRLGKCQSDVLDRLLIPLLAHLFYLDYAMTCHEHACNMHRAHVVFLEMQKENYN